MDSIAPKYEPFLVSDIPNLTGKVALVTGAYSSGTIGFHTAFQLAVKGATVYIGARNMQKAQDGINEMRQREPSIRADQLHPFVVDLGDLKAVQLAAVQLMSKAPRLDILVNNAALLGRPLDLDSHGISVSFNTNHLSPFVLTTTLLPLIKKTAESSAGVRVVTVSSTTHAIPPTGIKFDSLAHFNAELGGKEGLPNNLARYGLSKLANILFAKQLQVKFDAEGIKALSISLHPGNVDTAGAIDFREKHDIDVTGRTDIFTPMQGAITSLFASTSPKVWASKEEYGGAYLIPYGKIETPSENGQNAELAEELWGTSERVVESVLKK